MTWLAINLASSEYDKPSEPPSIAGLIYAGRRHVVSGPPESAKSLFTFIVALEHMRAGGIVVHIDFEQGAVGTRRMLADLGATIDEIRAVLHYEPEGPPDRGDIDEMIAAGATLAIVDALAGAYDVSKLDDNKRVDVERFAAAWIKPLWVNGIATLNLDHVVKNGDNRGKFSIGSERKIGQADVHLGLQAITSLSRGGIGLISIDTHKDRPGHLQRPRAAELELRSDPDTHAITWTFRQATTTAPADTFKPTVLMERVSLFVAEQTEPVSFKTVEESVRGKSRAWIRKAIEALIVDGYITETRGSHGARLLNSTRPFTSSPSSPDLAPSSPGEPTDVLAQLAHPLKGGEVIGEDEEELERLASIGRETGLA